MNTNWTTVVTFAGILFGFLVSFHFLTVRRPGIAIRWLGAYTLALTIGLSEYLLAERSAILQWVGGVSFLYGPFIYLYVKSRLLQVQGIGLPVVKHFLFFIFYCVILLVSLASSPPAASGNTDGLIEIVLYESLFAQIFAYCITALIFIRKNKARLVSDDARIGKMQIAFMRVLVTISMSLFIGSFAATHTFLLRGVSISFEFRYLIQILLCSIIFIIALLNTETMYAKKLVNAY